MTVSALIVAAGKGERAGGGVPKQFRPVAGRALVARAVASFAAHPAIRRIIVVIGAGQEALLDEALGDLNVEVIIGGAERQNSVMNGLECVGSGIVLIHDAARGAVPCAVIDRLLAALEAHDGATPCLPVVDTLARTDSRLGDVVPRDGLVRVQTPQAFHHAAIMTSHQRWKGSAATDDAQMARKAGFRIAVVEGDPALEKVTHEADFARMEAGLSQTMIARTGMGYDVHRLEDGEELWLGGILIPHTQGLSGHSDADVALHALVDALLGAIAAGDIGSHFPPSDPQWKGAASARFVEHARDLVAARGGIIDAVDLTIICEAPKIGPHRDAMRHAIATMLGIKLDAVSVKATTTERLGFAGRGEGIAAQAVANVRLPA